MVRVPHHDPKHGGSIFLTTLSLPFERLRALSLSKWSMGRKGKEPVESVEPQSNSKLTVLQGLPLWEKIKLAGSFHEVVRFLPMQYTK